MSPSDYGSILEPSLPEGQYWLFLQSDFTEGQYIDYRAFNAMDITPIYEFGFVLSYTTFNYSLVHVNKTNKPTPQYPPDGTTVEGGNPHLWDELLTVTATVNNTGPVDGLEVAQLYLGTPNGPIRQPRGFEKVFIASGKSATVDFTLTRRDLKQQWALQNGSYGLGLSIEPELAVEWHIWLNL